MFCIDGRDISDKISVLDSTAKVVVSGYSRLRQGLREVKVKSALKFNRISWTGRQIFEIDSRIVVLREYIVAQRCRS